MAAATTGTVEKRLAVVEAMVSCPAVCCHCCLNLTYMYMHCTICSLSTQTAQLKVDSKVKDKKIKLLGQAVLAADVKLKATQDTLKDTQAELHKLKEELPMAGALTASVVVVPAVEEQEEEQEDEEEQDQEQEQPEEAEEEEQARPTSYSMSMFHPENLAPTKKLEEEQARPAEFLGH